MSVVLEQQRKRPNQEVFKQKKLIENKQTKTLKQTNKRIELVTPLSRMGFSTLDSFLEAATNQTT